MIEATAIEELARNVRQVADYHRVARLPVKAELHVVRVVDQIAALVTEATIVAATVIAASVAGSRAGAAFSRLLLARR